MITTTDLGTQRCTAPTVSSNHSALHYTMKTHGMQPSRDETIPYAAIRHCGDLQADMHGG